MCLQGELDLLRGDSGYEPLAGEARGGVLRSLTRIARKSATPLRGELWALRERECWRWLGEDGDVVPLRVRPREREASWLGGGGGRWGERSVRCPA